MSAEDILRERLKEYRQLLEVCLLFIKDLKLEGEQLEQGAKIVKTLRDNGITLEQRPIVDKEGL